ncbi:NHLC4 protein, partial [Casuarius casuarius]|nr:NHLC4 protein [Casuarius casuarius]
VSNLRGPRYVSSAPKGGLIVSEEFRDVKLFTSSSKLVCSLRNKHGHQFGNPAGVCVDVEGDILVAGEQCHTVHLLPENGASICLVSADLKKPTDVACSFFGQLFVADTGENCGKSLRIVRPPY